MVEAQQAASSAPVLEYKRADKQHTQERVNILKQYFQDRIHFQLQRYNDQLRPDMYQELACLIVAKPDVPVKKIIPSAVNGPTPETSDEIALDMIQALAERHAQLSRNEDILHLLVSLPTNGQVCLDGSSQELDEATMRQKQLENYADGHPTINDKNLHSHQSNAALVEADSAVLVYSVLDRFIRKASELPAEHLFLVFNGHGTQDGKLECRDGSKVHMDDILDALQKFRQEAWLRDGRLQNLNIIFAQCYSYKLDWGAAINYDLINNVICLTENEAGRRLTHNKRTPDGRTIHVELMEHRNQTTMFNTLKQERQIHELKEQVKKLEARGSRGALDQRQQEENQIPQDQSRRAGDQRLHEGCRHPGGSEIPTECWERLREEHQLL